MSKNNSELDWEMYMYLLEDAYRRLGIIVRNFRQVNEGMAPFTYALESRRGLGVIGDELTRYSALGILPGNNVRSIIQEKE